jgi:hypothetical protein
LIYNTFNYGLPQVTTRMAVDLTLAEQALLDRALRKAAAEIDAIFDGKPVDRKKLLLYVACLFLETGPSGIPKGRKEIEKKLYQILYALCPKCLASYLHPFISWLIPRRGGRNSGIGRSRRSD